MTQRRGIFYLENGLSHWVTATNNYYCCLNKGYFCIAASQWKKQVVIKKKEEEKTFLALQHWGTNKQIFVFVTLNHCDKRIFCLLHWVTKTMEVFVCRNESQRQRKVLFVPLTHCNQGNIWLSFCIPLRRESKRKSERYQAEVAERVPENYFS